VTSTVFLFALVFDLIVVLSICQERLRVQHASLLSVRLAKAAGGEGGGVILFVEVFLIGCMAP